MGRSRGFTLVELIIVVAIIGILAAIAFPSYQKQVQKSNRAAAQSYMLGAANQEQLYLSTARAYADQATLLGLVPVPNEVSKFYDITVALAAGPPPTFTITATAKGTQVPDGPLTLDSTGTKVRSPPGHPAESW